METVKPRGLPAFCIPRVAPMTYLMRSHTMNVANRVSAWVLLAAVCNPALATDLYVAPDGKDENPGTKDRPVATLLRARDAVRGLQGKSPGPVTVYLRAGTHYLAEPLVLTPEDSGTEEAPVAYAAFPDEAPVLSGGCRLRLKWTEHGNGILRADVPGVKEGRLGFDQLFVNGRRQILARYPNYQPEAVLNGTAADAVGPERVKRWSNPTTGYVHGLHAHGWGGIHYRIAGVDDRGNAKLGAESGNNRRMGLHKQSRFVENIFEELDAPGEWYLDQAQGVLYFMPPQGTGRLEDARIEAARLRHLIELRGSQQKPVRFVQFRGLTFTHTARTFLETTEPLLRGDWCIYRGGAVLLTGTEDCSIRDCFFDAVGGNAVFVNHYARRVEVTGCKITEAGASGVCLVGDPNAVRSPSFEAGQAVPLGKIDRTPGPKTDNYPARCRVYDNLMFNLGRVEKQTAGVQISMAEEITVSHNSIYHLPRAGININDGTWGGHVIEFNDVFDTVRESSDHGSFNSWGRDRFWHPDRATLDCIVAQNPGMEFLDACKTTVLRNNRWRCDHGWDIDLDDGSSNYRIVNNVCLNGGLKLREGLHRTAENNVIVRGGFHPHVWFAQSGDVFVRNILCQGRYAPIAMPPSWGKKIDENLFGDPRVLRDIQRSGRDAHSLAGDPRFVAPATGDYRVHDGSPALRLGFKNFPMDQFGVIRPALRAEAKTPPLPVLDAAAVGQPAQRDAALHAWLGAKIKDLVGAGEMSATGMGSETGVLLIEVPADSPAAAAGLRKMDVILSVEGKPTGTVRKFLKAYEAAPKGAVGITIYRNQKTKEHTLAKGQ
jgi:hypothetical protein